MTFKERLFLAISSYRWWQRYLVTLCMIGILCASWWFLSYRFVWQRFYKARMQQQHLFEQNNISAGIEQEHTQQVANVEQTFKKQCKSFFLISDINHIVHHTFLDSITKHHLMLETYSLTDVHPRDWHAYGELKLILRGHFFDIIAFYEDINTYSNIVCQRSEMTLTENQIIRCVCIFSIYLPLQS